MHETPDDPPHDPSDVDGRLRFATLVMRQLDDVLTEREAAELAALLRARPERRHEYAAICIHAQTLTERLRARSLGADALSLTMPPDDRADANASLHDALVLPALRDQEANAEPESRTSPVWSSPRVAPVPSTWRRRNWAVAAGIALIVTATALMFPRPSGDVTPTGQRAASDDAGRRSILPTAAPAAVVTGELEAEWAAPFDFLATGDTVPASPLELKSGFVSLRFSTGVQLTIEGPARFEVQSEGSIDLSLGRICADVPEAGHGFAVHTPSARVIDLGTSFGVAVTASEGSRLEVFEGRVQLGSPLAGTAATRPVLLVDAGGAKQVDIGGTVVDAPAMPGLFVRPAQLSQWVKASGGAGVARWRVACERLSRDPSLVLFYTFDNQAASPGRIPNRALSAAGRWSIPLHGRTDLWGTGRLPEKAALSLSPTGGAGVILPDYPPATNGRLSVAAWVYARSMPKWAAIVKNRGDTLPGQFSLGLENDARQLVARVTDASGRDAYARQADGSAMPVGQWVHVAFVADGQTLRLYLDGKEVGSVPCGGVAPNRTPPSMAIGMRTGDSGKEASAANNGENWDGMIDELAVFHRALSAEDVRRLSAVGRAE